MDAPPFAYIPGTGEIPPIPLARYLPPLPEGMAAAWLREHIPSGSWILEPLGAAPALALEAARAGYSVLVASNNPILRFLIETLAKAPARSAFQAALANLSVAKRGSERLEQHISGLYNTTCENCGAIIPAEAFLWRKEAPHEPAAPYARIYTCGLCQKSPDGERPITPADLEQITSIGKDTMQRARAIQRVLLNDTEHRGDVEEALECYPPRSLYALFTLLNKVEGLGASPQQTQLLQALLLSAFDSGSTLAQWSGVRARPKQLTQPAQFRENNLWMALENAVEEWSAAAQARAPIPVTHWPNVPPASAGGSICLYHGRVKTLLPLPANLQPKAVITAYPRPNQAFWTLSTLWAGWLWGPDAALPLRSVLERRRYDWSWHTSAVFSALAPVGGSLPPDTPLFGLLPELNPGFLSAAVVATQAAGFSLDGLALRAERSGKWEQDIAQLFCHTTGAPAQSDSSAPDDLAALPGGGTLEKAARASIQEDLRSRSEPVLYRTAHAAALMGMAPLLPRGGHSVSGEGFARVQAAAARVFADRSFLQFLGGPAEEGGWWWLAGTPPTAEPLPLTDRIEMEIVRCLQRAPATTQREIETALHSQFPQLQTPDSAWTLACLESYGERVESAEGWAWQMRAEETSATRRQDLLEMEQELAAIGKGLGLQMVKREDVLAWMDAGGTEQWRFYRMASSIAGRFVFSGASFAGKPVLVLPGSRAPLLAMKRLRDQRLNEALQGWHILKFRHLRELAQRGLTTQQDWQAALEEDPVVYEAATQMTLFNV